MGMREREQAAIGSAIAERLLGGADLDDQAEFMRNPTFAWCFGRFAREGEKAQVGYVAAYFKGTAWITARGLAVQPKQWGPQDFVIPAATVRAAVVSLPSADRLVNSENLERVTVHPLGGAYIQLLGDGGWYTFTHLDGPNVSGVAFAVDGLLKASGTT